MTASSGQAVAPELRASASRAFRAVFVAAALLAWAARFVLPVSARFPAVVSVIFAAAMLLAIQRLRGRHPFDRFGAANQVTTIRAALTVMVASLAGEAPAPVLAGAGALTACLVTMLDGVDGWLARKTRMASDFGARFDMEVDAFLILALAILAWQHGKAGAWVLLAGALRYLFIAAGVLWSWMQTPLFPSVRRQTICVIQIAGLIVTLLPDVRPPASAAIAGVALSALCYSFVVDTLWLWRQAS